MSHIKSMTTFTHRAWLRVRWFAIAAMALMLAFFSGLVHPVSAELPKPVTLSVAPTEAEVLAAPCGLDNLDVTITNTTSQARYVDIYVIPEGPLLTTTDLVSTYLPANDDVVARVQVSAPEGAAGGNYSVGFRVGRYGSPDVEVPVTVNPRPSGPGANLAVGGPATASSTHGNFTVCGGVDGDKNSDNWSISTGWNDGTRAVFPDWYAVQFPAPTQIGKVVLYSLDSARYPAARNSIRDWDVQVLSGTDWVTVASVRGNTLGAVTSTFPPVTTSSFRILALMPNDAAYNRIVELEAYAE